jgi:hypothetical protein
MRRTRTPQNDGGQMGDAVRRFLRVSCIQT